VELLLVEATEGKEAVNQLLRQNTAIDDTFASWCDQLIEKKKDELSKNSLLAIKHIASIVNSYEQQLTLQSINDEWLASFRSWLVKRGLHNHTINIYLSRFHKIVKEAFFLGKINYEPVKIKSLKTKESVIIYLNAEELQSFETTPAVVNAKMLHTMQIAKDYFLFMCYTGVRYSDFIALKPENVKSASNSKYSKYLHYVCQKNNAQVTCPLHNKALAIIDKYQNKDNVLLFPMLKKTAFIYNIKKHAQNAGIVETVLDSYYVGNVLKQEQVPKYQLLSPHAARHTFATNYIANGGNIVYLQKLMGHKSLNMTQSYVEILKPNMEDDFYSVFGK
jgi:site-specific recombinase XerD